MNTYYLQKGFCYFKFKFNPSIIAEIKAIEGRRYNPQTKEWYIETSLINNGKIKTIIDGYGFELNEKTSLLGEKLDESVTNSISEEEEREGIEEIKKDVAKLNLNFTPRPFQWKGIFYMSVWGNMILGDDCGCIDGNMEIQVNRCGRGFTIKLSDLYLKFNQLNKGNKRYLWDKSFPTYIKCLNETTNEFTKNEVIEVVYQGQKQTVFVELESGKHIVLTPDHEVLSAIYGWIPISKLTIGDKIYSNGVNKCKKCGGGENIITYIYSKYVGYCKNCMYKYLRENNYKGDSYVDKDGYILINKQFNHPKNRDNYVREHILVMEKFLGRYLEDNECVHHLDGNKKNNNIENLQLMTRSEHAKLHSKEKYKHLETGKLIIVPKEDKIVSIKGSGVRDVYDIVMKDPHRNFVANKVVVHNCGKTLQTIFTAELNNWFPCLIICPASTNYQWGEKWREANPNRIVSVIESPKTDNWDADVVIVKCTSLAKSDGEIIKYGKEVKNIIPKYPELLKGWKYCVLDEIHFFKEKSAGRSQIAKKIADKSEIVLGLSGTLVLNRTKEIINPLILTKQFTKLFGTWQKFVERYCNATKTHFGWDTSGSSNLMELNSILKANCYLRREKNEVRKDQPPVQESYYYIDITNKKEYQKAENEFIDWLVKSIKDENKTIAALNAESLVQRSYLKKLSVKGKMKAIKQWIDDFLETSNEKLIVAGMHTEPLEDLTKHYKSKLINGSVSSIKKRRMVKEFGADKSRLLFVQIQSVGTGTDGLQDSCSNMLVFELPDRPTDLTQLYARIDRDGQKDSVNINLALCKETIDEVIWQSLKRKDITTSATNKGIDIEEESLGKDILTFYLKKAK
jgi:SWI/SNF-related matrix-associated actin-dependent regulator 1 of chromatin subfamily A